MLRLPFPRLSLSTPLPFPRLSHLIVPHPTPPPHLPRAAQ
ncbi:protein of unknown function [Paraburkholderia dioscoreae]|uniref:Uncharacterized protein n=1 Tax=Paraburkholderia dioscoreae TaxID=2604047 RepID=A0A5Q4ZJV4_9BURK|nr:protein of unknown function [Paraburkholderia dioscoreae]